MRLKNTIQLLFTLLVAAGAFLALQAYSSKYPHCNKKQPTNKMIWENLPQQFFSSL